MTSDRKTLIAFDSETYAIQPGLLAPPSICWSIVREGEPAEVYLRKEGLTRMRDALDSGAVLVGANIAFDLAILLREDFQGFWPRIIKALEDDRIWCTHIAQKLIDNFDGLLGVDRLTHGPAKYSLAYLVKLYLEKDISDTKGEDTWRVRYSALDGVPLEQWPAEALEYSKNDALYALLVARSQRATGNENLRMMGEEMRKAFALHLSAVRGVRTDPSVVTEVVADIEAEQAKNKETFLKYGIYRQDKKGKVAKDMKRLRDMVIKAYRDAAPRSEKGNIKTDRQTLSESGDPILEAFAKSTEVATWASTFVPIVKLGTIAPINPRINTLLETGRVSYSQPNLTNQPRNGRIRECYTPREGFYFCSVDYSTLELCTLAQACIELVGYSEMGRMINEGFDLHVKLASVLLQIPYEEALKRHKAKDKQLKNFRQMCKAPNFGLPGGLGAVKLVLYARTSYDAKFCELESGQQDICCRSTVIDQRSGARVCSKCLAISRQIKDLWFTTFPEVKEVHDLVSTWTGDIGTGRVQVPMGGMVRGGCGFCDGSNTLFQGLAARGATRALYRVTKEAYGEPWSALYGSRPVIFVHDEIICEVPIDRASYAAKRQAEVMISAMREVVPDVKVTAEPALMRRWYKAAEPVWQEGRLVPWEPK